MRRGSPKIKYFAVGFLLFGLPAYSSDFAVTVEEYIQGGNVPPDYINGESIINAANALGAPTSVTTDDQDPFFGGGFVAEGEQVPVVPVYPPFRSFELVSIGTGGVLTVSFDHKVLDEPGNPYGLDFIVFSNVQLGSVGTWSNRSPDDVVITANIFPQEKGAVSVSQDGTNWFALASPRADDSFAPTLGRMYDPDNVDTNLGTWNQWWGEPTDPTLPVDPAVVPDDLAGMTVTDLVRRYGSSAGGTGFDISSLALPSDPVTGHKWIQYVRVEGTGMFTPEIDAFSDVAALEGYPLWVTEQIDWLLDPDFREAGADIESDGKANLIEFATASDPNVPNSESSFTFEGIQPAYSNYLTVSYMRSTQAVDVVISVQCADAPGQTWMTNGVVQELDVGPVTNGTQKITAGIPLETKQGGVLRLHVEKP